MRIKYKSPLELFSAYFRNKTATIAVAFALMAPVVIGAAGMALDFAQAYLVQQRLLQALDAAALAAASSSSDPAEIEQRVDDFFDINYPDSKLGITFEPVVEINGGDITVTGNAQYNTTFLRLIGITEIDVTAVTSVRRQVAGIEVAMVLDNTGSMSLNDNIDALKDATESFVNILFARAYNPEYIKIGLVPYANAVNVGRYGLGLKPNGTNYAGDPFVNLPDDFEYTTDHTSSDWYGCVVEHKADGYRSSARHSPGSKGQFWQMGSDWDGHGWDAGRDGNDPYPDDVLDDYEGPWDPYAYGRLISRNQRCSSYGGFSNSRCTDCTGIAGRCASDYCLCWLQNSSGGTNRSCPKTSVLPMTSDQDELLDHIETMEPHGNTLGNIGMLWGYRLISPEPPFEEGVDWDNDSWRKVVVMMTDGSNTDDGLYSAYWFASRNDMTISDYNERFAETCEAMKDQGITIYTVTFYSNINDTTKEYYEDCASSTAQYYDAPTQEDLITVFEEIGREISNLHITR